jgi:hypothetical protein
MQLHTITERSAKERFTKVSKKECISLVRDVESLLFRAKYDSDSKKKALKKSKELVNLLERAEDLY